MMKRLKLPDDQDISIANKAILKKLDEQLGRVPNFYRSLAFSRDALHRFLSFQYGQDVLSARQKTVIHLVVSEANQSQYSLAAYTEISRLYDFTPDQVVELRSGSAGFDLNLDPLVKLVKSMLENKGCADDHLINNYFAAGYTNEHLTDCILAIGEAIIANFMHATFNYSIDFKGEVSSLNNVKNPNANP